MKQIISNHVSNEDPNFILQQCVEVSTDDVRCKNLDLFQSIGNPNRKVHMYKTAHAAQTDSTVLLPIYDEYQNLCQWMILEDGKNLQLKPDGCMNGFALYGDLNKERPIIVTYTLEAFFKVAQTKFTVVLVVPASIQTKSTKLKTYQLEGIQNVIYQLYRTGFKNLYLPIPPENEGYFSKVIDHSYVNYIPLHHYGSCCDLSQYDDSKDLEAFLSQSINYLTHHSGLKNGELAKSMNWGNGKFNIRQSGIYYIEGSKGKNPSSTFISSPIFVKANTRDESSNNWGILLQWADANGVEHNQAIPMEIFQTDGTELRKTLANQGVRITSDKKGRDLFQTYLMNYKCEKNILCVSKVGWHGDSYVLPSKYFGESKESIVYQSSVGLDSNYSIRGDLDIWRQEVSMCIQNHDFLVFALCTAFTGQFIQPLNQQGCGFHFKGSSSKGKTTALYLASSVWGKPKDYIRSWKATGNALEHTAYMHNDGFLALDEISEIADSRELGNIVYMLANGVGKGRMSKSISPSVLHKWNLIFLSSGEKNIKELMLEQGQNTKLGQHIRLAEIDIDCSEHGIFSTLDFERNASKQAIVLNKKLENHYGVAGQAWLEFLTQDNEAIFKKAAMILEEFRGLFGRCSAQGAIQRVANHFALVATAGEIATQAGITGWKTGTALQAVFKTFHQWLVNFEQTDKNQVKHIFNYFKKMIIKDGSKFEKIGSHNALKDRVGFYKVEQGEMIYFILKEHFEKEICKNMDLKLVIKTLHEHGYLVKDKNRYTKTQRIPNLSRVTMSTYAIKGSILNHQISEDLYFDISLGNMENIVNMIES